MNDDSCVKCDKYKHIISSDSDELESIEGQPKIPPGVYDAKCLKAEFAQRWKGQRGLYLTFVIIDDLCGGIELFMVCNWPKNQKITPNYKAYKQWCLAKGRLPEKGERLSKSDFVGKYYRVLVRDTDRKNAIGERLPDFLQYSVVDSILSLESEYRSR